MNRHANKVLVSLALLVSMLFSLLPNLPQATATDLTAAPTQEAAVLPEKSPVYQLDASCKLLSYVDEAVFAEGNHIARLPSEETLSTYAFLNSDGTKTVYYMNEAVKFIDADGAVVEKDITLTAATGGYTTTRNNISLALPSDPAKGIRLTYEGKYITLTPQGGTLRTAPQATDSSVMYPNYFGAGMSLVYTPTLSGVKEDIVLRSYTGVNSFTFTLNTNGLNMYQANGRYYLAESKTATRRFELGDVVAFDARGRFSVGTMTVTTVMPGQAYRITITTDEDFLTDPETVYPVAIDPTIGVSDNTHGAGAIEDTTIYQGRPTANGNWTYLHCGYYSSTYTVARTLFRLTGLTSDATYQSMSANDIVSANFYVREATGTAALDIKLLANAGSAAWTESGATWNNAGVVLGTEYARASAKSNSETVFNITNLVKDWKANPQNAAKGFVLVSTNETTRDKAFYSSEFGTTGYRPFVMVTYNLNTNPPVADGVYRIISKSANLPIGANRSIADKTNVVTQITYTQYSEPYFQLWKITHLGGGLYSVRPLHKLSMALCIDDTGVGISEIGLVDAMFKVPASARWYILSTSDGYIFKNYENENATMMVATTATTAGTDTTIGTYSAGNSQFRFDLSPVTTVAGALFLFQPSTNSYASSFATALATVSVSPGETLSLADIGFILSVCDTADPSPTAQWSSSNEAVATVDTTSGIVTTKSLGETTIRAVRQIGQVNYTIAYKLVVTILDGTYYIRIAAGIDGGGTAADPIVLNYLEPASDSMYSWMGVQLGAHSGKDNQRWIFTNLGDGTYTIRSTASTANYYLSTSSSSPTDEQTIVLKTGTVDYTMMWKISQSAGGGYRLVPYTSTDGTFVLGKAADGSEALRLRGGTAATNDESKWYLYQANPCNLNVYYDETHLERKSGNVDTTVSEIISHLEAVREKYFECFNIRITYNMPILHSTYATDFCENLHYYSQCECISNDAFCRTSVGPGDYPSHHTNIKSIIKNMPTPIGDKDATVLYVGHPTCYVQDGRHYPNKSVGLQLDGTTVASIMTAVLEEESKPINYARSLTHEIGHLFGAIDHYGKGDDGLKTTLDMNLDPKYDGNFSDDCLYGQNRFVDTLIICEGCQNIIKKGSNMFFDAD